MPLDLAAVRSHFPALSRTVGGLDAAYLDGPAGTQVPQPVIDAVASAMVHAVSNVGGPFAASRESEQVVEAARQAGADLLGGDPAEIAFGANMTSLTFSVSRALSREWGPGDRVVVTRLDHDANVTPWVMAAMDRGAEVAYADIDPSDVTLDLDALREAVDERTRVVAVTACSNAFGTKVDVEAVAGIAHEVGATLYVDAVHLAPHASIDVVAMGADLLVCSAYKFFGPHVGMLWGRRELLDRIEPYKVRPAPGDPPGKLETGSPSFPLLAGLTAAVDYLASLGEGKSRREQLVSAYAEIGRYELDLGRRFLEGLPGGVRLWGRPSMEGRVPTFAVEVAGRAALEVAGILGAEGVFTWPGHYYALEPMDRLDLLERGGLLRIGFVHYNTEAEVDRALAVLRGIAHDGPSVM